jgi:hypothetical protein
MKVEVVDNPRIFLQHMQHEKSRFSNRPVSFFFFVFKVVGEVGLEPTKA